MCEQQDMNQIAPAEAAGGARFPNLCKPKGVRACRYHNGAAEGKVSILLDTQTG
jgi:hypothetical protein